MTLVFNFCIIKFTVIRIALVFYTQVCFILSVVVFFLHLCWSVIRKVWWFCRHSQELDELQNANTSLQSQLDNTSQLLEQKADELDKQKKQVRLPHFNTPPSPPPVELIAYRVVFAQCYVCSFTSSNFLPHLNTAQNGCVSIKKHQKNLPTDNGGVNKKGSNIPVIQYFLIANITVVLICLQNLLFFGIPESRITRFFFNLPDIQSAK